MTSDGMDEWPTGRLLSTAARLVEHSWEDILRSQNMTHAGLISLHTIADRPASQRDIAKASRVTDQTISRTIDRLERAGYVTRRPIRSTSGASGSRSPSRGARSTAAC